MAQIGNKFFFHWAVKTYMAILFCKLVEAETDLDDLTGLREFFQDVRMIGIGEATHGLGVFLN